MPCCRRRSALTLALAIVPGIVVGQGLGEAAKREKERRKGKVVRSVGDDELKANPGRIANPGDAASPSPSPSASAPAQPPPASESAQPPAGEATARATQEARWRARAAPLLGAIARLGPRVEHLRAAVAAIERDVTMPYDTARRAELAGKQQQLRTASLELDGARAAYARLEDEARRAGVPPGWIR
jgi:hypothetical protein